MRGKNACAPVSPGVVHKRMKSSTLKWLESVQLSSIPLRKLSPEKLPVGIASGCMINYLNRKILLSVFHATGKEGNWAVELRFVKGKGTELYYPGAFNFDVFNIIVMNFAYSAYKDPRMKKFINSSIGKGLFGKLFG